MSERTFVRRLRDFGFSQKEAAVYRSLLELGEAKPSQIATAANVSTRYVYEVGERLQSRGFVTVDDHVTPTVMSAIPPGHVIEGLRDELEDLEPILREQYEAPGRAEMHVEVIKTSMALKKRARTAIEEATDVIGVSLPQASLATFAESLKEARRRDVLVLLVLEEPPTGVDIREIADVVRIDSANSMGIVAADERWSIVMSAVMLERSNSGERSIVCADESIGQLIFGGFIGTVWSGAEEVHVPEPATLPETYTTPRRAVLDGALHLRDGISMEAEIEGFREASDERIQTIGTVVDIHQSFVEPTKIGCPFDMQMVIDTADERIRVGPSRSPATEIDVESIRLIPTS